MQSTGTQVSLARASFVVLFGAVVLSGCGSGSAGQRPEGVGAVSVALSQASCVALEAATVIDSIQIAFDPSTSPLEALTFTRAQLDDHCAVTAPGSLAEFSDVPVGSYTANAGAYRSDDVLVGSGSEEFGVLHAEVTHVKVTLTPLDAKGDVSVDIEIEGDWSELAGSGD